MVECAYCDQPISRINASEEHIIQNALGGLYVSKRICCDKCNGVVQRVIDNSFCAIFSPIVAQIKNIKKTNDSAMPSCRGTALHSEDGKLYDVIIKNGKIVDCPEYKKTNKRNLCKSDLEKFKILYYHFNFKDQDFRNGICKVAFSYAIEKGIPKEKISNILIIEKDGNIVQNISFKSKIIPFVPLNAFDRFLELDTQMELSHSLILYSCNNYLVCYVDLFNAFQHYVILSETWDGDEIYQPYCQVIQKIDRTIPEFNIYRTKHIYTLSAIYGVQPTMNIDKLEKDIATTINKEPYEKSMGKYITKKLSWQYSKSHQYDIREKYLSISFYMDDDDVLRPARFRRFTPCLKESGYGNYYFYPTYILELILNGFDYKKYTYKKFQRLTNYLSIKLNKK